MISLAQAKGYEYRFIGLSNTETDLKEYIASASFPFPVFAIDSTQLRQSSDLAFLEDLDLTVTPQTIEIAPGGDVEKVRVGAFNRLKQAEVERFFGASLPGLVEPALPPRRTGE